MIELTKQVSIYKINKNFLEIFLDESKDWMKDLLEELQEDIDTDDEFYKTADTKISFKCSLVTKDQGKLGDVAVLKGELEAEFCAYDITEGKMIIDRVSCLVKAAYLDSEIRDEMGFADETTYLLGSEEHDLYFYADQLIDVAEVLHEYLFLNKNPYPKA